MLQINDTLISFDVLDKQFICDLNACKGACCVEGEEGAPLESEEVAELEAVLPLVWDVLPKTSQEEIERHGVSYKGRNGEDVVSIVNGAECVFMVYDEKGISKCAIENAFLAGKTTFRKPISCYLYPIRVDKYTLNYAVNYHRWHICSCAEMLGKKEGVSVYQFLKEPLIAKFGEDWYEQLEIAAKELKGKI